MLAAAFCFAGLCSAALPIENCADVWRVSYNKQKLVPSLEFDAGQPSTVTVLGKEGSRFFWMQDGFNGTDAFDVVVKEELGLLYAGNLLFKQGGELKWYSKSENSEAYYDCSEKGVEKRDEFSFRFGSQATFTLVDGKTFTADYLVVSAKRPDAFRLKDDFVSNEFYVLSSRVLQGAADYGEGSVFFASPTQPGKFEEYYAYFVDKPYARVTYVGCCAAPLATLAPSATPAPSAEPGAPAPSVEATAAPAAPSAVPTPSPTPFLEKPVRDFNNGSGGVLTALVFVVVFAAFAAAVFFLARGKHAGVEVGKSGGKKKR